jgi:hypothetical protein
MLTKEQLDNLTLRCKKQWKIRYDEIEALITIAREQLTASEGGKPQVADRAAFARASPSC